MRLFAAAALAAVLGRGTPARPVELGLALRPSQDTAASLLELGRPIPGTLGLRFPLDVSLTDRLHLGEGKLSKTDGAAVRFFLAPKVDVSAGVYRARPVPGAPSDWRFLAVLKLPFP